MKKTILFIGALLVSASLFAHDQFMYTGNLDVSGEKSVKLKVMMGHPYKGKEAGGINVGTVNGKTTLPKEFFVVHNGEKTDLLSKVKLGKIKTDLNESLTFDSEYGIKDGLKGSGSWVFFMEPGETTDIGYSFKTSVKLIVIKDSAGDDYNKRVAPGSNEIIPLLNPVNAWKENVFRGKLVDRKGNPVKNARIDISFFNTDIDLDKNIYKGGNELEKSKLRVFTDDNGVFAFVPSRAGKWVIRGIAHKVNKQIEDSTLVVQFE